MTTVRKAAIRTAFEKLSGLQAHALAEMERVVRG
jgi:hypothetical protein